MRRIVARFFEKDRVYILKRISSLAIPSMIEMLLTTLVGIADTVMIGRYLEAAGISAMSLANQIIFPIIFIFSAFNAGTTAIVARHIGAREYNEANEGAGQSLLLNTFVGIFLVSIMVIFHEKFIRLFPANSNVINLGIDYLRIVIYSQFFMLITFSISSALRGAGDTKTPMYVNGAVNLLNILGNWLLIYGVGIFPEMGIAGAALSTTLSRALGAIFLLIITFGGKRKIRLRVHDLRLKIKMVNRIARIGWSAAVEQFFMQTSFIALNFIIVSLGEVSHAIFNMIIRIESISFMPAFGISIAATTLVGQNLGAKEEEMAVKSGNMAALLGSLMGLSLGMIFFTFPRALVSIFVSDITTINTAIIPMRIAAVQQCVLAAMIIYSAALRGAGDTKMVMYITIFRVWGIFVPLTYLLVKFTNLGIIGVFITSNLAFLIPAILFYYRFKSRKWINIEV
ncbi:MATE family efflux transporter [Wukongibacter baidiensis]|uniref:MATE family efflux transporter n=1 Tax=Wukongibacter baidiensis TaxID=1723361 RepID=UPI003D7F600A